MTILKIIVFIYSEYLVYFILMIREDDMYQCVWGGGRLGRWMGGGVCNYISLCNRIN